jgi:choline dehydrogenase-like flavoprotein
MIESLSNTEDNISMSTEVAVVGAGPAGIVTALKLARSGLDVLLIESGDRHQSTTAQELSEAASWDHDRHADPRLAVSRQLGGTSNIWGGRCVPFDPIDFVPRPQSGMARWPVTYDLFEKYFAEACQWLVCGRCVFDAVDIPGARPGIVPGFTDGEVLNSTLERWSLPTNFAEVYGSELASCPRLRVVTGLTCVKISCERGSSLATGLECVTQSGRRAMVAAKQVVIACGGLESTRLLLASEGPQGGALGNHSDHLGRYYMAHIEGVAANVRFNTDPRQTIYGYERDIDGVYVRRRFTFSEEVQQEQDLPNIALSLANPELADASHRSGMLSLVYLMLMSPLGSYAAPDAQRLSLTGMKIPGSPYGGCDISPVSQHLYNILREPLATSKFALTFGYRRLLARGRKVPGFSVYSDSNVYPLEYHAEHLPNRSSRVTLSDKTDRLGLRQLDVDIRFSRSEVEGVARALDVFDKYLRQSELGQLEYVVSDVADAIANRAGGGFHQIGTTRMSTRAEDGVVDTNLAIHTVENVHVVSSSAFVTSGQANSTFMIVVLALRLADHLGVVMRS